MNISTTLHFLQQHDASRNQSSPLLNFGSMNRTETRQQNRRARFNQIRQERFKTSALMAEHLGDGFSPSFVSQLLRGHRGIGDELADKIEARLDLPSGHLDLPNTDLVGRFLWALDHTSENGMKLMEDAITAALVVYPKSAHSADTSEKIRQKR